MVQSVGSLRLSELIVHVIEDVEAVHVVELRGVLLIEELLLVSVEVFAVVHDHLPVGGSHEPLVIRLQEGNVKGVYGRVDLRQLLQLQSQWVPLLDVYQDDLAVFGGP